MEIQNGYNNKKVSLRLEANQESRSAGLWIEFENEPKKETLSYMTLNEMLDLKHEIQIAINKITR